MRKASEFKSAFLATPVYHMLQAMAVFQRAGLPVIASTTDMHVVDEDGVDPFRWPPNAKTTAAWKE